ncbi:unnamed protein product [Brassica oleracea var. botrytis]
MEKPRLIPKRRTKYISHFLILLIFFVIIIIIGKF